MRYKCHYCGKLLVPGVSYTLECSCGNCNLGFDRTGKVDHFKIVLFEKGKDIFLVKDRHSESMTYGFGKGFFKPFMDKVVMQVAVTLQFDEEGTPQVYKLWEKLNKLIVFS